MGKNGVAVPRRRLPLLCVTTLLLNGPSFGTRCCFFSSQQCVSSREPRAPSPPEARQLCRGAVLSHDQSTHTSLLSMSSPWTSRPPQSRWSSPSMASRPTTSPLQLLNNETHIVFEDGAAFGAPSRPSMKMPFVRKGMATAAASGAASSSATNPRQLWTKGSPIIFSRNTAVPASSGMAGAGPASIVARARQRTASHHKRRSLQTGTAKAFLRREGSQVDTASSSDKENADASDKEAASDKEEEEEEAREVLPPQTDLPMKMPLGLFRAARDAPPGSPESFWTYTLYRREGEADTDMGTGRGPGENSRVKVHYSRSLHTTERVCLDYFVGEPLLGFDLEWMAGATRWDGARKNVCLVQLASPTRIGLFHLSLYPNKDELVAPALRRILEDPAVVKAGVFIKGDCTRLRNYLKVDVRGTMELSHLHKLVKYSQTGEAHLINKRLVSLADQVQEHLRLPMFKGIDVRAGDWSKPLQMDQIIYSASDAYAAVQIYSVLEKQRLNLSPVPPRPAFAELGLPIKLADGVTTIATAAEDAAEEDKSCPADGAPATPLSPETARAAKTSVQFETDNDGDRGNGNGDGDGKETPAEGDSPAAAQPTRKKSPTSPKAPKAPKHPRIVEASNWLASYRAGGKKVRAQPAALRAYYLWHGKDGLHPVALAALLRDPPLQTATVVSYVLQAVQMEHLPYDKERLRSELLSSLPENVVWTRYSYVARASGFQSASGGKGAAGRGYNRPFY